MKEYPKGPYACASTSADELAREVQETLRRFPDWEGAMMNVEERVSYDAGPRRLLLVLIERHGGKAVMESLREIAAEGREK